jgi:4-amino-4-deoxy-L-arabinose transferase-like glycosyltransferase
MQPIPTGQPSYSLSAQPSEQPVPRPGNMGWAARIELVAVLAVATLLRVWNLGGNGFGTQYYAAGVASMLDSWHNFFFNSFDPAGFVSIDKPPIAFWLQAGSAKLFGFNSWSIHIPQVIEGVASVALLHHLVRRRFGRYPALLAALFLAITPINVAIDRSNNTDSCLVLGLLATAWVLSLATEAGSRRMLLASMAMLGVAFNVKMLAAIVVLPPFMAVYLLGAPLPLSRRVADLLWGIVPLVAISLLWCVTYDLTPVQSRPYAGSTKTNSMLELVIGQNGIRRFVRTQRADNRTAAATPAAVPSPGAATTAAPDIAPGVQPLGAPGRDAANPLQQATAPQPGSDTTAQAEATGPTTGAAAASAALYGGSRASDRVPVGPLRLVNPLLADQMGWLYPLALAGVIAWLWRRRVRLPLNPVDSALLLWLGWVLTYSLVLSYAGGIFHSYYLAATAPPVCALAAVGVARLWEWFRAGGRRALALPLCLLIAAAWQSYIAHGYLTWELNTPQRGSSPPAESFIHAQNELMIASIVIALLSAAGLLLTRALNQHGSRRWSQAALTAGILAVILTPAAWALGSMEISGNASSPAAQPPGARTEGEPGRIRGAATADPLLMAFLSSHYHDERFYLATLSSQQAAPIIIATGKPVMAMGGFAGTDPILTPESLSQMVQQKELRFVLIGAGGRGGFGGRAAEQTSIIEWIQQHGKVVEPALWRSPRAAILGDSSRPYIRRSGRGRGANASANTSLFDLRPDVEAVPPSSDDGQGDLARANGG